MVTTNARLRRRREGRRCNVGDGGPGAPATADRVPRSSAPFCPHGAQVVERQLGKVCCCSLPGHPDIREGQKRR